MCNPILIQWRVEKIKRNGSSDIVWDGDPAKLVSPPFGCGYCLVGKLTAWVGNKEIGNVTINSQNHAINNPPHIDINAYSFLFPQKVRGGYGKEFGDVLDYAVYPRTIKKPFDLAGAKAYVENAFLNLCKEAGLGAI